MFEAEQFLTEILGARHVIRRGDELVHSCLLREHEHDIESPGASLNQEKLLTRAERKQERQDREGCQRLHGMIVPHSSVHFKPYPGAGG